MKCDAIIDKIKEAEEDFKQVEKQLMHAFTELNKRIYEHDMCVIEKTSHVEVILRFYKPWLIKILCISFGGRNTFAKSQDIFRLSLRFTWPQSVKTRKMIYTRNPLELTECQEP